MYYIQFHHYAMNLFLQRFGQSLYHLAFLFSCSETAFLSVSKIKIRTLAEEGNKKAKLVESLLDNQDRLLSAILVGNNLVNIGASTDIY